MPLDPTFAKKRPHDHRQVDENIKDTRVPVWGILTEPLRGTLRNEEDIILSSYDEYIPAALVKFIEQTGAKVVPVSYKLTRTSLYKLLNQLSGLAIHGDS